VGKVTSGRSVIFFFSFSPTCKDASEEDRTSLIAPLRLAFVAFLLVLLDGGIGGLLVCTIMLLSPTGICQPKFTVGYPMHKL
jgi:hypothetical protein